MSVIVVSLRKDLSIVEADGGESLNQQSAVAKASFEKDGVSCLPVNMFPPYILQVAHLAVVLLITLKIID